MDYQTLVKSCLDIVAKLFKFNVNNLNLIWHTDNDIEEYISFYNHERIIMKFKNNPWKNLIFKEN